MATEKRLIDAHDLWTDIMMLPHNGDMISSEEVEQTIKEAQTVDAVEVVHGRWEYYSTTMMECSNCKRHTARHKFKYCPHCGAVMEDKYNDG